LSHVFTFCSFQVISSSFKVIKSSTRGCVAGTLSEQERRPRPASANLKFMFMFQVVCCLCTGTTGLIDLRDYRGCLAHGTPLYATISVLFTFS
jgi:hypothetical protein